MKKKLIISNFQRKKEEVHKKICAEYLELGDEYGRFQKVQYLAQKYNRSTQGIIIILKAGGFYESKPKATASC